MDKKTFISFLRNGVHTNEDKLACIDFFINNYPVKVDEVVTVGPFQQKTGRKFWTKIDLQGRVITGGQQKLIDYAIISLRQRINELESCGN